MTKSNIADIKQTNMDCNKEIIPATVVHWNYRGFTEFPLHELQGEESEITDIYLKENLITRLPSNIGVLEHLESLYLSGNDITELPKQISKLRCLKCLDVSGNRLRGVPEEIGEARCLKFLILDENELTELPLRIAELRCLRYLSVCDNKLQWIPQRPVYNYHHCEFRFWRNPNLKSLPYSLWYHMFRDQQTRSLNIGCLNVNNSLSTNKRGCRLKLSHAAKEFIVDNPSQYNTILEPTTYIPPSLFEISKRLFYQMISDTVNSLNTKIYNYNYHSDITEHNYYENNVINLEENFEGFNISSEMNYDENGNKYDVPITKETFRRPEKSHFVPADVINDYFYFLPSFLKSGLCNGPVSRCENVSCKKPLFDQVYYEFCFGDIILIDKIEEVLLHVVFCSKACADKWKRGKTTISWTMI